MADKYLFGTDEAGWPVMMADAVVEAPPPAPEPAKLPEPEPEPEPAPPPPTRSRPADIEVQEWEHRSDALRDAARENDMLSEGDVHDFLRTRLVEPDKFDAAQFITDVRAHRVDDLVDILDHRLRSDVEGMIRTRRYVRLVAPKGWVKRTMNGLTDEEFLSIARRLEKRGYEKNEVVKHVLKKIANEERRGQIIRQYTGEEEEQ